MRSYSRIILTSLILLLLFGASGRGASGQSDLVNQSRQKLVEAFAAVQRADFTGISPVRSHQLVDQLNAALSLQQNANITGSASNASLSINLSSQVASQAASYQNEAQVQTVQLAVLLYFSAFWGAVTTAFVLIEVHRLPNFLRKRRMLRSRIESEAEEDGA